MDLSQLAVWDYTDGLGRERAPRHLLIAGEKIALADGWSPHGYRFAMVYIMEAHAVDEWPVAMAANRQATIVGPVRR